MENSKKLIGTATKWSSVTEILAKLVSPISNMILARILTPEAFGVVATTSMIFSFAEIFTDAGFQRYLIQHEFKNAKEFDEFTAVAFWTNMAVSILFCVGIILTREQLAILVGNPGLGSVIAVSCVSLPIIAFSSIQMALYRRDFDFKTLFVIRMLSVIVPLVVTIPIALITHSYWALITGTICGHMANAVVFLFHAKWKPRFFFRFYILKQMLSFSIWSLLEAITIWMTNYIGIFFVGTYLSAYYVGLYKTAMNTVNQILNLITSATMPVLFSALSRYQTDRNEFVGIFYSFQRSMGLLIVPMGFGILLYHDLVTQILLGKQWMEAANFIGLWSCVNALKILLSNLCSEAYRAVGKPKASVFVQLSQLAVLIPAIIYGSKQGFAAVYVMRCLVSVELSLINLLVVKSVLKISPTRMIANILPPVFASLIMSVVAMMLQQMGTTMMWDIFSVGVCIIVYFVVIFMIPSMRKQLTILVKRGEY